MSAHTDSEFNARKIASWAAVIALGSIVLVVALVSIANLAKGSKPVDPEAINLRIAPVATVKIAGPVVADGAPRSGEQIYKTSCFACHDTGAANAPKLGDKVAWASRLALGLDGLLKSAIAGKNAMPPKGGSDASETELASAIVYLANKSGGDLKEPAAK